MIEKIWKEIIKKVFCTPLEIIHCKKYEDQDLFEILLSDGHLISKYVKFKGSTCTCTKSNQIPRCKHYEYIKTNRRNIIIEIESDYPTNEECGICFEYLNRNTKTINCNICKNRLHKACLIEWLIKGGQYGGSHYKCIFCLSKNYFIIDNQGYIC